MMKMTKQLGFAVAVISIAATLLSCSRKDIYEIYDADHQTVSMDSEIPETQDAAAVACMDSLRKVYGEMMDEVVGYNDHTIDRQRPQDELSNVLTDMVFDLGDSISKVVNGEGVDFSLLNFGGIRKPLNAGDITLGDIFSILPFDNMIVLTTIKGSELRKVLAQMNDTINQPFSHLAFTLVGHNAPTDIIVNGKPLDDNATYRFATIDFISGANRGDNILRDRATKVPFEIGPVYKTNILLRDAFLEYIWKVKTVNGYMDQRVRR